MIKQLALALVEAMINRVVVNDPTIHEQMRPLYGRVVAIEIADLPFPWYVAFDSEQVTVQGTLIGPADLTVRGELPAFIKLANSRWGEIFTDGY